MNQPKPLPVMTVRELQFNEAYGILVATRQFAAAEKLLNWKLAQLKF